LDFDSRPTFGSKVHADSVGTAAENKKLSQDRAVATRSVLVADGVPAKRITMAADDEEKPTASNDIEERGAKNRRSELVILNK
jgi:OOP family OmpA-OmpF porin